MTSQTVKILTFLFILLFITNSIQAQKKVRKALVFYDVEMLSGGPEFVSGDVSSTLKQTGMHYAAFSFLMGLTKNQKIVFGINIGDWGSHRYMANAAEQDIIEGYEIVTTTTNSTGFSTTSTRQLEKITLERMNISLPIGFQSYNKEKKFAYLLTIAPAYYSFSSSLPKKGSVSTKNEAGFGVIAKVASDYLFSNGLMAIRLSYTLGTLPDFDLALLPGLRNVQGTGISHALQVGFIMRGEFFYR